MKWKESAVPQMSAPAPRTVKTPPDSDALPATATDPMSFDVQGDGNAKALTTLPAVQCPAMHHHSESANVRAIARDEKAEVDPTAKGCLLSATRHGGNHYCEAAAAGFTVY
jgi:hypothetical protein